MAVSKQQLRFATERAAREASAAQGEPASVLEDRLRALTRFLELPVESSPLFTRHTEPLRGLEGYDLAPLQPTLGGPRGKASWGVPSKLPAAVVPHASNDLPGFALDKWTNLPRALASTGAVLHVPRDTHVEEPFTVRYAPGPGASFARTLLVLEQGARATVVEEVHGEGKGLFGSTTEVLLGEGAELRLLGVDTSGPERTTLASRQARTGPDAKLEMHHAFVGGALTKARSDVALQGRGSRVQQSEVVFGGGQQRFDLTSNIAHTGPDTTSDALSKAVLKEQARANVKGVITITQEGKGSDSYLGQHAMLLSKQARCIAIPSLEIVNREIQRAKHAATVAQVDEAQVFYLQTRGLPEQEARKAIVLGFLGPLLGRLGEERAARVQAEIEARWG
jgi:Fe-S cluster assembly protein SufB